MTFTDLGCYFCLSLCCQSYAQTQVSVARPVFGAKSLSGPENNMVNYPHTVVFQDGCEFTGKVVSFSNSELMLSRPDCSAVIRINRDEIRRLCLGKQIDEELGTVTVKEEKNDEGVVIRTIAIVKLSAGGILTGAFDDDGNLWIDFHSKLFDYTVSTDVLGCVY